jgi:two-component system KDP operon response regulator KdpE
MIMNQPLVLVVEDDDAMRRFLRKSLQKHDYRVIDTAMGNETSSMARTHNPEIVILDLGLPDIDGSEFLKSFRTWSHSPVIILSARRHELQKVRILDIGADDYLTKPFGLMELLARIRVALRHTLQKTADSPIIAIFALIVHLRRAKLAYGL